MRTRLIFNGPWEMEGSRDPYGGETAGAVSREARFDPAIDVFETEEGTVVRMEIAGMRRRDISVELVADILVIRGRRRERPAGRKVTYHRLEIEYGAFERRVRIASPVREDAVSAVYREGLLEVRLPRRRGGGEG
ncbi:MAG: Hsp20/alpha crystallin family protein [bacterium]|nr:Hsp20/alpha crystallin family protein [bacterium]